MAYVSLLAIMRWGGGPSDNKNQAPRYLNVFRRRFISVGWSIPPSLFHADLISFLMDMRVLGEEEEEGR